jgi:hypothetical protein
MAMSTSISPKGSADLNLVRQRWDCSAEGTGRASWREKEHPSICGRLLIQRAAAIRWWHVRYQKVSYALVCVNLIFYF